MQTLSAAYLQITKQWGDVIRVVIDVAPHDGESAAVLATAQKRHNHNLSHTGRILAAQQRPGLLAVQGADRLAMLRLSRLADLYSDPR
jgi:hypothetical protein